MPRATPSFRCLSQPLLIAGAERTPAILVVGATAICAVLAYFSWSLYPTAAAALLFMVGMPALRELAKRDPRMVEIAFRFSSYRRHYPAHARRQKDRPILLITVLAVVALVAGIIITWWML
jgi:type IV secretory pathway TrbD component